MIQTICTIGALVILFFGFYAVTGAHLRRIRALEARCDGLVKLVTPLYDRTEIPLPTPYSWFPKRTIPAKEAVEALRAHLGLQWQRTPGTPATITLIRPEE